MSDMVWLPQEKLYADVVKWLENGALLSYEVDGLSFEVECPNTDYVIVDEDGR